MVEKKGRKLNKLEELLLFILDRAHKKKIKNLSDFQLVKIFYLLQIFSIKYTGSTLIPEISFFRHDRGPLSKEVYQAILYLRKNKYIKTNNIPNPKYGYPRHANKLNKKISKFDFGIGEEIFLDNFLSDLLPLSQKDLKKLTYNTEPMKEILKKEQGKIKTGIIIDLTKVTIDPDVVEAYSDIL